MLAQKVEDMINTVVRQIAFYEFERACTPLAGKAN
jgi:oligoendopeptidase F